MKFRRRVTRSSLQIDFVPMIDIIFQLVLFFLVSTTFVLLPGITLTLPQSTTAESVEVSGLTITLDNAGAIWFNNEHVSFENFETALQAYPLEPEKREMFPVNIEADELVTNGMLIKIFDVLRRTGFAAVNLRTLEGLE